MVKSRRDKLVGAVVSLPTFTDDEHNLLLNRQRKHIRWLIDQGITQGTGVLMAAGGYGEGYFLEDDEFYNLTDVLAEEASGKVPTMMGIFDLSARAAARKARYAADKGIDFIELGMPHYSLPSEEDVFRHHKYVSDHADIGIMSYNNFWVMPPPGVIGTNTGPGGGGGGASREHKYDASNPSSPTDSSEVNSTTMSVELDVKVVCCRSRIAPVSSATASAEFESPSYSLT